MMVRKGVAGDRAGTAIKVHVSTRASKTRLHSIMEDGTLKIQVAAPPVDGKANHALIAFLAGVFNLPEENFEIISGKGSSQKLIAFRGINEQELSKVISEFIEK